MATWFRFLISSEKRFLTYLLERNWCERESDWLSQSKLIQKVFPLYDRISTQKIQLSFSNFRNGKVCSVLKQTINLNKSQSVLRKLRLIFAAVT